MEKNKSGKGNFPPNSHSKWGQQAWFQYGFSSIKGFLVLIHVQILHCVVIYFTFKYLILLPFQLLSWPFQSIFPTYTVNLEYALMFFWVIYWLFFYQWKRPEVFTGDGKIRKVAVIGSGPCGLVSVKEALEEGHDVDCYEASDKFGGIWNIWTKDVRHGSCWKDTVSSASATDMGFSDFQLPHKYPNEEYPYHVTQENYLEYIKNYVKHFDLEKRIIYNSRVTKIVPNNEGENGYDVYINNDTSNPKHYDWIIVCTGLTQVKHIPSIPGLDIHKKPYLHASSWRNDQSFEGKDVLVVGIGESASDVIPEVASTAKSTTVAVRNNTLVLGRNFFGYPPDFVETRAIHSLPPFLRWALYFCGTLYFENFRSSPYEAFWLLLHKYLRPLRLNHPLVTNPFASFTITKADTMFKAFDRGLVSLQREVKQFTEDSVIFIDGTKKTFDQVIFCTGYNPRNLSFLPEFSISSPKDLAWGVFYPKLKNFAVIGFSRTQAGGIVPVSEMQARWVSLLISKKRNLPNEKELMKIIERDRKNNVCWQTGRIGWGYDNYLARNFIGCEPPMLSIFLKNPSLWWRMTATCVSISAYRLVGPHAKPEIATKILSELECPQFFALSNIFGLLCHPFWDLPWFRYFAALQPGNSQWY